MLYLNATIQCVKEKILSLCVWFVAFFDSLVCQYLQSRVFIVLLGGAFCIVCAVIVHILSVLKIVG